MAVGTAVAKRLARQLDELFLAALPDKRQIVGERIAVPQISLIEQQLQTVRALGAGAPAGRPLLRATENHLRRAFDDVAFFVFAEVARDLVVIPVTGDFMTLRDDVGDGFRIALGDTAARQKRRLDFVGGENPQNSVDAGFRAVFGLGIFFMIHSAIFVGPDIFAALKIKAQEYRHAGIARPIDLAIGMKFLQRHANLLGSLVG